MPNDAKLGLVLGMALVIAVAVVFFRKEPATAQPAGEGSLSNPYGPLPVPSSGLPPVAPGPVESQEPAFPIRSKRVSREPGNDLHLAGRLHTVQAGDTLFSLAQHYYGDGDRFVDIYRMNRRVLKSPDGLEPGTVLVIPESGDEPASAKPGAE